MDKGEVIDVLKKYINEESPGHEDRYIQLRQILFSISPFSSQPVDGVRWVHVDKVEANEYNPNAVAREEMRLLYVSIWNDGYTQPVVTVYDAARDKYVIVDGFHRFLTMKTNKDISDRTGGMLPIVVINKDINDRMASTVRHNRARGKHAITGMAHMVFEMLENGWEDARICNELGMEAEELIRLKHITGFSKLFENVEYQRSWETRKQIQVRQAYEKSQNQSQDN